jgi:eukaryotic-like serine/threonine-protein kinase
VGERLFIMAAMSIGNFQIVGPLGTGAHSTILHIRRSGDGKNYALKVVPLESAEDEKFHEQARHEYRVAQMLDHPNLIKVYALEPVKDWLFRTKKVHLLIEYVNGKTLDACPKLRMGQLLRVFKCVADALVHMHRRQVLHADLKPNNIMLSRSGEVKVLDFGLSWIKGEGKDRVQGTPEYMAPEQVKKSIVNERTDIYNFGATMYRLLTWRLPPNAAASQEAGFNLDTKSWASLLKPVQDFNAEAPPAVCDLVHKCLAFNPLNRPERMSEVQGTLDHFVDEFATEPEDELDDLNW